MKIKNAKLKKINLTLGVILFITVFSIAGYRLLNPVPSLEKRGCMDRLNKLAMFQEKYFQKHNCYTPKLNELSKDKKLHFYHQCPLTKTNFVIEFADSNSYKIVCKTHNISIEDGILKKH